MNLSIKDNYFVISFEKYWERWRTGFKKEIKVPLSDIVDVNNSKPTPVFMGIGWSFNNTNAMNIRAGSFLTPKGKEFWYRKWRTEYLVLELRNNEYKRIVLGVPKGSDWVSTLRQYL